MATPQRTTEDANPQTTHNYQEIVGRRRERVHTSDDEYRDGPQGDDDWKRRWSEEQKKLNTDGYRHRKFLIWDSGCGCVPISIPPRNGSWERFGPPFRSKHITAVPALNLSASNFGDLQTLQTPSHTDTLQSLKQYIICRTPTKAKVKGWQQDTDIKAESEKELRTGNQSERNLSVWRLWGAACRLNLLPIPGKKSHPASILLKLSRCIQCAVCTVYASRYFASLGKSGFDNTHNPSPQFQLKSLQVEPQTAQTECT
ncbi:uncharacterized protein LOC131530665 isoform X2 [Onychostoma macrolepis]|uniref:uncharacterized protein LOC131530665 isoform X2 n=1 Tax=Onychostoma macrolepis TaxID=369639 RepID=UPI00272A7E04|nr:uncharacterized protein LOC131530665 isoform X2 [Onychostoma macrolepis]